MSADRCTCRPWSEQECEACQCAASPPDRVTELLAAPTDQTVYATQDEMRAAVEAARADDEGDLPW